MPHTITIPKESFSDLAAVLPLGIHDKGSDGNQRWNPKAKSPLRNLLALAGQKSSTVSSLSLTFEDIHETGAVLVSVIDHHSTWPEYTFPADRAGGIHRAATTYQQEADKAKNAPKPGATLCILARVATTDPRNATGFLPLTDWSIDPRYKISAQDKNPAIFVPLIHPETGETAWHAIASASSNPAPHWLETYRAELQARLTTENGRVALHLLKNTLEAFAFTPRLLGWLLQDGEVVWAAFVERDARYKANCEREEKEREERRQSAKAEALAKLETDWVEGRPIPRDAFEDKAKAAGYSWNIRTLGAYRKAVASVSRAGSVTFGHKTGKLPAGVSCAIFEAIQAIASKTAETGGAQ